jgi:hypothetical protein
MSAANQLPYLMTVAEGATLASIGFSAPLAAFYRTAT